MGTKKIHSTMERVYRAAIQLRLMPGDSCQTELSCLINVSPQVVNNWEKRGVSKDGRLKLQQDLGINANWVESGIGEMLIRDLAHQDQERLDVVTKSDVVFVKTTTPPSPAMELVRIASIISDEGLRSLMDFAYHIENTHPRAKQTRK